MLHLRITPVRSASRLQSAANPNELADEGYTVEDGFVVVEDQAEADRLLSEYSNLELDLEAGAERAEAMPRATMEADGVEYEDEPNFDAEAFVDRTPMAEVIEDIERGEFDDHLDAIEAAEADNRDRVGVADAIADRRE